ncbi:MAG: hypothetical protein KatS3mg105_2053 [Gemmatales bacterium]|nr:MAG: hypothetical protein KatS3mg105_2053 [Gemmatales bacterium]
MDATKYDIASTDGPFRLTDSCIGQDGVHWPWSLHLPLHVLETVAIVPPFVSMIEQQRLFPRDRPKTNGWARAGLLAIALGIASVFAVALWLDPYDEAGRPRRMETHRQLGLPPCTCYDRFGIPCPSCGMTTSFSLLAHGDVWNSLKANFVGTLLAVFCFVFMIWCVLCSIWRRFLFLNSLESFLTTAVVVFVVLLLTRWLVVLAWMWGTGEISF